MYAVPTKVNPKGKPGASLCNGDGSAGKTSMVSGWKPRGTTNGEYLEIEP